MRIKREVGRLAVRMSNITVIVRRYWRELMIFCHYADNTPIKSFSCSSLLRFLNCLLLFPWFPYLFWLFLLLDLFFKISLPKGDIASPYGQFSLDQLEEEHPFDQADTLAKPNNSLGFLGLATSSFDRAQILQKNIDIVQTKLTLLILST